MECHVRTRSVGLLDRTLTAVAHQLPRDGQHGGSSVYKQPRSDLFPWTAVPPVIILTFLTGDLLDRSGRQGSRVGMALAQGTILFLCSPLFLRSSAGKDMAATSSSSPHDDSRMRGGLQHHYGTVKLIVTLSKL
ncbi:unnamed protein product [Leuciscus chuanchicus]